MCVDTFDPSAFDAIVLPGGFAPDYMRRSQARRYLRVPLAFPVQIFSL